LDLKITLPKKWLEGPFKKIIDYCVDFHKVWVRVRVRVRTRVRVRVRVMV
jgi:hypothetical protein